MSSSCRGQLIATPQGSVLSFPPYNPENLSNCEKNIPTESLAQPVLAGSFIRGRLKMIVSYCITCMGRLWQLRRTLPAHLQAFKGRTDIEIVLLDYNSRDGLDQWITNNGLVRHAIERRLLTYAKEHTALTYHSSKAKNIAHRLAKGDVLMNLDADNWAMDVDPVLRREFDTSNNIVFHARNARRDGSFGRIALGRYWFFYLGGYNELLEPVGYQDVDLLKRAMSASLIKKTFLRGRHPLRNTPTEKLTGTHTKLSLAAMIRANSRRSRTAIQKGDLSANPSGWGAGLVSVNFGGRFQLQPIFPTSPEHETCVIATNGLPAPGRQPNFGPGDRFRHIRALP